MTQSIESMIEVLQAYKDGKKIEFFSDRGTWEPLTSPSWDFSAYEYRIAPEPKKKVKYWCFTDDESLFWIAEDKPTPCHWIRVPSEDKEIEV